MSRPALLAHSTISSNKFWAQYGKPSPVLPGAGHLTLLLRCSSSSKPKGAGHLNIFRCCSSSYPSSPSGKPSPYEVKGHHSWRCFSSSYSTLSSSSPYCSPVIDISDYFLSGSKAPKIPDFIGPVRIGRTPDARGRGLFLTQDVSAGDVLIVSNAFATSYDDTEKNDICQKIALMLKESPRALRQFYALAGTNYQNKLDVPDVELFDSSIPYHSSTTEEPLEIDDKHIRHIVQVNSFSGKLTPPQLEPKAKFNGLWLLPSFMNHSCSPSASRNMVGEVMLFMAGRDMKANEEITISYTDCLVPLKKRDDVLQRTGYGFLCKCERCVMERSVQDQLEEITERYFALFDNASEEVYSVATTRAKGSFSASKELGSIYEKLARKVSSMDSLSKVQKQWILGGYASAFLANFLTTGYSTDFAQPATLVNPTAIELVKAMMATVPGMQRTLSFAVMLATIAPIRGDQITLVELAMDECTRVYGKQKPDITRKLALQAVELVPFF